MRSFQISLQDNHLHLMQQQQQKNYQIIKRHF